MLLKETQIRAIIRDQIKKLIESTGKTSVDIVKAKEDVLEVAPLTLQATDPLDSTVSYLLTVKENQIEIMMDDDKMKTSEIIDSNSSEWQNGLVAIFDDATKKGNKVAVDQLIKYLKLLYPGFNLTSLATRYNNLVWMVDNNISF